MTHSVKNGEYWRRRFDALEAAKNKAAEGVVKGVEDMFAAAQRELEGLIQTWYGRFAANNQITLAEAKRLLKTKELDEFRWDVNEYITYAKENALNQKWVKQLENASARFHISRLEALRIQAQQTAEKLFAKQYYAIDKLLRKQYLDGYYHTYFEMQKGFNIGWDIAAVDEKKLANVLAKPWTADGKTFSGRIWEDKNRLISTVHTELSRNMILGKSPDAAIKSLAKVMGTSLKNAGRLIMTESAFFSMAAQREAFIGLDVESYEVLETLDGKTCAICGAMDGQVFAMSDFKAGVSAPPFHPFCRGDVVPFFDDDAGERAARGADGKTYYVPGDMKYGEWKKGFVDGEDKNKLQNVAENGTISTGGVSGALNPDSDEANKHAKMMYEEIRHRSTDIKKIADNTEFTEKAIEEIKQHMFIKKHDLGGSKLERFYPSFEQAQAWDRLTQGKHTELDIILLRHEYVELTQMRLHGYDYDTAHKIANGYYNWGKLKK